FGPRWQCPLARAIGCDDRLVRRWVAEERPVSVRASRLIEAMTRDKHREQMRRLRAHYLDMIAALADTGIRNRLLAMDLNALRVDDQLRQASLGVPRANGAEPSGGAPPRLEAPSAAASVRDPVLPRFVDAACSLLAAALCTAAAMV